MPDPTKRMKSLARGDRGSFRRAWKESHGNALMGFAAAIFLIGLFLIWSSPPVEDAPDVDLAGGAEAASVALPENALVVKVTSSEAASEGPIRIAIYDSKEAFGDPEQAVMKDSEVPVDGFVIWEIKLDALPDSFAIAAYHDLDDNGELNKALFNAPVEPYGFSNNARSLVGPPTFDQTIMQRPEKSAAIEVRVY